MEPRLSDQFIYDCVICAIDDAFDVSVAQRLQEEIIRYRLPKKPNAGLPDVSYNRVWVHVVKNDQQVPPSEVADKLKQTRWLILVCSRMVKDAMNMQNLINLYVLLGRKQNILPLLIEGDPQDSFPPQFFEVRETKLLDDEGSEQIYREIVEPLAVDIRGDNPKHALSHLAHAKIKVVAALIGVSYDALEQRHYKRVKRRIAILSSLLLLVPIILGSVFTYLWINAEKQIRIASMKSQIAKDLFVSMCSDYPEKFSDIPQALPIVNDLLLHNLVKLKVADSVFIKDLEIESLLIANQDDDITTLVSKAMLARHIEKKEEALKLYQLAANKMEFGAVYASCSEAFVNLLDPYEYPSGISVLSIDDAVSEKCGLQEGDIIVALDGFKFRSMSQYEITKQTIKPDVRFIEISILRPDDGRLKPMELKVKPEDLVFISAEM